MNIRLLLKAFLFFILLVVIFSLFAIVFNNSKDNLSNRVYTVVEEGFSRLFAGDENSFVNISSIENDFLNTSTIEGYDDDDDPNGTNRSRIVVTFKNSSSVNYSTLKLPKKIILVKMYGRRLVLSLDKSIEYPWLKTYFGSDLVADIELDSQVLISSFFDDAIDAISKFNILNMIFGSTVTDSIQVTSNNNSQNLDVNVSNTLSLNLTEYKNNTDPQMEIDTISKVTDKNFQWNLADSEPFSIHVEHIWKETNSTPYITIAVLDSGLASVAETAFLHINWGFDFVSDTSISMDGDGRDFNSSDPGDIDIGCSSWSEPSWHGTKMASILAANHETMAIKGVAQNVTVMPIRVLGSCGSGYANDVADAIVWASGGQINGMPLNQNPAQIISLSLSGSGFCPSYLQSAVNQAISLGSIILAAAGNDGVNTTNFTFPANCVGVFSIGASTRQGSLSAYSNYGSDMVAPGDNILVLSSLQNPTTISGTSAAVPHIAGMIALLWDGQYSLTLIVQRLIQSSKELNNIGRCVNNSKCSSNLIDTRSHSRSDYNDNSSLLVFSKSIVCPLGTHHNYSASDQCVQCSEGTYNNILDSSFPIQVNIGGAYLTIAINSWYCHYPQWGEGEGYGGIKIYCNCGGTWRWGGGGYFWGTCGQCGAWIDGFTAYAQEKNYCYFCKYGYFQNKTGSTSCDDKCPFGTYTPGYAPGVNCITCPSANKCCRRGEYYNAALSTTSCTLCEPGKYSIDNDRTIANLCPVGQYNSGVGMLWCLNCAAGNFSMTTGSTSCSTCSSGFYAGVGWSACSMCIWLICNIVWYAGLLILCKWPIHYNAGIQYICKLPNVPCG
jgi:subtilisin family serine protease